MKKILGILVLGFLFSVNSFAADWKVKNKWKISCGIVDKESLVINGKPKTRFVKKKEFKLESVIFKLDKGDIGSCPTDKKPVIGKYEHSGRQYLKQIYILREHHNIGQLFFKFMMEETKVHLHLG